MRVSISGCILGSVGVVDNRAVRVSFRGGPYQWPDEADAKLVTDTAKMRRESTVTALGFPGPTPTVIHEHKGYAGRQVFLRSYTFSRKETATQKAKKCWSMVTKKLLLPRTRDQDGDRKFVKERSDVFLGRRAVCKCRFTSCYEPNVDDGVLQ